MAFYWQGMAGDVNFRREFASTERRFEPGQAVARAALMAWQNRRRVERPGVACASRQVTIPTRRWTRDEVMRDREESMHRLQTGDTTGWMEGMARLCVNQPERLPLRYGGNVEAAVQAIARFGVEWTDEILPALDSRPETLALETQAIRIGDIYLTANPGELFASLGLSLRDAWAQDDLFLLGYANGSIGYLPDAPAFQTQGYATDQSPKFTGQFPFTAQSGSALVAASLDTLRAVH